MTRAPAQVRRNASGRKARGMLDFAGKGRRRFLRGSVVRSFAAQEVPRARGGKSRPQAQIACRTQQCRLHNLPALADRLRFVRRGGVRLSLLSRRHKDKCTRASQWRAGDGRPRCGPSRSTPGRTHPGAGRAIPDGRSAGKRRLAIRPDFPSERRSGAKSRPDCPSMLRGRNRSRTPFAQGTLPNQKWRTASISPRTRSRRDTALDSERAGRPNRTHPLSHRKTAWRAAHARLRRVPAA